MPRPAKRASLIKEWDDIVTKRLLVQAFQATLRQNRSDVGTIFCRSPLVGGIVSGIAGGSFDPRGFIPIHRHSGGFSPTADDQPGTPGGPLHQDGADDGLVIQSSGDGLEGKFGLEREDGGRRMVNGGWICW